MNIAGFFYLLLLLAIFVGIVWGIVWLTIKKNTKLVTTVMLGLVSLVSVTLGLPLFKILSHLGEMSAAPLVTLFAIMLIACTLGFFAVLALSVVSVIKMIGVNKEDAQSFLKKTFRAAVPVSAIALITVLLSSIVKAGLGMTIANILFSNYGNFPAPAPVCITICSLLILVRSIAGLHLLNKEQEVTPEEEVKILSNRIFLSITSIVLSIFALLSASFMAYFSFFGSPDGSLHRGQHSLIELVGKLENISPAPLVILLVIVLIICSLGFMAVLSASNVPAIMTKVLSPEKAQKFFKKTFFAAVTVSAITLITFLLSSVLKVTETIEHHSWIKQETSIETKEYTIADFFGSNFIMSTAIFSGLVLFLGIVALFLLKRSKIVSEKVKRPKLDPHSQNVAPDRTIKVSKEDISSGAETVKQKSLETCQSVSEGAKPIMQKTLATYQNVLERAKAILFNPKETWTKIESENTPHIKVFTSYVLPLTAIVAVAAFISYGLIGYWVHGYHFSSADWGFKMAITLAVTMAGGVYLTAFVINALSENFDSRKDFNKAFSLVAYAYTPALVGGIFHLFPNIAILASLTSIYSLYLLYIGLQPMMQTPEEKKTPYFVISLICLVAVYFVLEIILKAVLLGSAYSYF